MFRIASSNEFIGALIGAFLREFSGALLYIFLQMEEIGHNEYSTRCSRIECCSASELDFAAHKS